MDKRRLGLPSTFGLVCSCHGSCQSKENDYYVEIVALLVDSTLYRWADQLIGSQDDSMNVEFCC
jgi:hypothetical protein